MLKRITIYFACALLIFVSVRAWSQQIDIPVDFTLTVGPPLSLTIVDDPGDYGLMPWPPDSLGYLDQLGEMGRTLQCNSGFGSVIIQVSIAPMLTDLFLINPDQPALATYFKWATVDDPGNDPVDLFNGGGGYLDPGAPLQTVVFQGDQGCMFHIKYFNEITVAGQWTTQVTFSIITQ